MPLLYKSASWRTTGGGGRAGGRDEEEEEEEAADEEDIDFALLFSTACFPRFSMGSTTLTDAAGAPSAIGTTEGPVMPIHGIFVFHVYFAIKM